MKRVVVASAGNAEGPAALTFAGLEPARELNNEVLTALGNGYLGQRASLSALGLGAIGEPAFYVAGVFNKHAEENTSDLVSLPSWSALAISDGADWVDLTRGEVRRCHRRLDLATGVLSFDLEWRGPSARITRIEIEQFVSMADRHAAGVRFRVTPKNYSGPVAVRAPFVGNVGNGGKVHLEVELAEADARRCTTTLQLRTRASGVTIRAVTHVDFRDAPPSTVAARHDETSAALTAVVEATAGHTYTVAKTLDLRTDRRGDALAPFAHTPAPFEELLGASKQAWAALLAQGDVRIDGDAAAERALRFMTYHLLSAGHHSDGYTSIPAKGLCNIPGVGYRGHAFWDTEMFMVPYFTHLFPDTARRLLLYRYHTLAGARAKARDMGYAGAAFPWESTDSGSEETPRWVGTMRIWCGENEQHITADVAYAVDQYVQTSGDVQFMQHYGAEILLETARFWTSRAEYDRVRGAYVIRGVIGPDEYHEGPGSREGGVDNSVYTNWMARWNINRAIATIDDLPVGARDRLLAKVGLDDYSAWKEQARAVADGLAINFDRESGMFEQFDGYFALVDPLDCEYTDLWMKDGEFVTHAMDALLAEQPRRIGDGERARERAAWTQICKQADVVMLLHIADRSVPVDVARRNFAYYAARTSHGSSLSDAMHALVAARLGDPERAMRHFRKALAIDLGDEKGNAQQGIHAAALGGAWMAVISGFGGVRVRDAVLEVNPCLPASWRSLELSVRFKGTDLRITATHTDVSVRALSRPETPLEVRIGQRSIVFDSEHPEGRTQLAA